MTDRQWFEWVYGQYYEKIKKAAYRIKLRKLGRRDEPWAEDITQTVFDKLYECMSEKDLRHYPAIEKWLAVTLRNTIGSELQKAYHRCEMQLDDLDTCIGTTYEMLADDPFPPELTRGERAILYLRFCEERSHEEIAGIFGCTCEASRARLSRAVKRYKKFKKDEFCDTLDKDDPLPDPDAFDAKKGLERFYERRSDAFAADRESAATSSISSSRPKHRRLPKLFLIAAVLVLLVASSAQAFHFNVFDLFARWTSEIFHLDNRPAAVAQVTRNPLTEREERTYDSVEDMLSEFGITAPLLPTWVPERFASPEISATYADSGLRLYIAYGDNESFLMIKANQVDISNLKDIEKDQADAVSKHINGKLYYFMSDIDDREKVIWQNGEFECRITGTVTRDEMEQIISSIEKG